MSDHLADPFLPGDVGSIAVMTIYRGLRRAGAGLVEAALIVGAQIAVTAVVTQAQQDPPPG